MGISIVHHPDDAEYTGGALNEALAYGDAVLVEAYLDHPRELEMSVVGNSARDLRRFGPGEIFPGHEFYDYSAKYSDGVSRTTDRPDDRSPSCARGCTTIAGRAYLAIGAAGFARVDFLLAGDELYLNEINTIPGFTPISLFPVLCRQGGYDFADICERIVELALERAADQPRAPADARRPARLMKLPVRQPVARGSSRRSAARAELFARARSASSLVVASPRRRLLVRLGRPLSAGPGAGPHQRPASTPTSRPLRAAIGLDGDARPNVFRLQACPDGRSTARAAVGAVGRGRRDPARPSSPSASTNATPLLIWRTSNGAFLVDVDGHLAGRAPPADSTLPAVDDQRATAAQTWHSATASTTSTWRRRGCC